MPRLSIITINRNNLAGLRKTVESVLRQTCREFEYIIIDGASTDGSAEYVERLQVTGDAGAPEQTGSPTHTIIIRAISEPDTGIYNAMNKGLRMATGEYIQILNSGDILATDDVTERMLAELERLNAVPVTCNQSPVNENSVGILYGNMVRGGYNGKKTIKSGKVDCTLLQFYLSTMNHDCCYIRRDLFGQYGYYDENLRIVSDWKWFLQAIGLGHVKPVYVDIDVTIFDLGGISEQQLELRNAERRQVLEEVLPPAVLADYDRHAFAITQIQRLKRHHLYGLVWFMERVLFKLEKWGILKR